MEVTRNRLLAYILACKPCGDFCKLKKPKFKYYGNGYWRGVDRLGRISGFYTWKMLWKMYDRKVLKASKDAPEAKDEE